MAAELALSDDGLHVGVVPTSALEVGTLRPQARYHALIYRSDDFSAREWGVASGGLGARAIVFDDPAQRFYLLVLEREQDGGHHHLAVVAPDGYVLARHPLADRYPPGPSPIRMAMHPEGFRVALAGANGLEVVEMPDDR